MGLSPFKHTNNNNNPASDLHTSSSGSVKIPAYAWKTLAILSCIATMVMYAETMLIPAIPDLIKDFHVSYSMSSWILTAYLVSGAVMTPIAGKLSDIYGRKKILLIIMMIYPLGVCLAGFSSNIYFMLMARAIQGIGMSMFPIAFGIVRDKFPREKISIGQGVITSMFASGAVIGLAVGGIIIQNYGWRTTFFTIIPVTIVLLLVIRRFIHVNDGEHDNGYDHSKQQQQQPELQQQAKKTPTRPKILQGNDVSDGKGSNNNLTFKMNNNNDNDNDYVNNRSYKKLSTQIDVKGAIALAVTVASFLLVLTFMETSNTNYAATTSIMSNSSDRNININNSSGQAMIPFLTLGIISFILFI